MVTVEIFLYVLCQQSLFGVTFIPITKFLTHESSRLVPSPFKNWERGYQTFRKIKFQKLSVYLCLLSYYSCLIGFACSRSIARSVHLLCGLLVKALDCGSKGPGFQSHLQQRSISLLGALSPTPKIEQKVYLRVPSVPGNPLKLA